MEDRTDSGTGRTSSAAYDAVLLSIGREWRETNCLPYFIASTRHLWVYTHDNFASHATLRPEFSLERYESGDLKWRRTWYCPRWFPKLLQLGVHYAGFVFVALFLVPARSWAVVHYPLLCFGRTALHAAKGLRIAYWVWDHFEDLYPAYAWLDDHAAKTADATLFVSRPMIETYARRAPAARPSQVRKLLPHGTQDREVERRPVPGCIGFIGNVREEDGFLSVIDILTLDPTLHIVAIVAGPFQATARAYAEQVGVADRIRFFGRTEKREEIDAISAAWQIGLAPYAVRPYSNYLDPLKIKLYWQQGLPVVTTAVVPMRDEIEAERAGVVVPDQSPAGMLAAIRKIQAEYPAYEEGARRMRRKYEYQSMFDAGFEFMRGK